MLAIIGGAPARFAPLIDLYRQAVAQGHTLAGEGGTLDGTVARSAGAAAGDETAGRGEVTPEVARGPAGPAVGINSHTYLADTSQRAADEYFPAYSQVMNRIGRERGWPPMSRQQFDAACSPAGHLLVGSPQQVAEKILAEHELFGHDRFLAQISIGTLPHERVLHATELFGTAVAPVVREALAPRGPSPAVDGPNSAPTAGASTGTHPARPG